MQSEGNCSLLSAAQHRRCILILQGCCLHPAGLNHTSGRIDAREQVAQSSPPAQGEPDPPAVLGPVMQQVAPLAECLDVAVPPPAVRRVVVEMRRRQHHLVVRHGCCSAGAGQGIARPRPSRQVCRASSHQRHRRDGAPPGRAAARRPRSSPWRARSGPSGGDVLPQGQGHRKPHSKSHRKMRMVA